MATQLPLHVCGANDSFICIAGARWDAPTVGENEAHLWCMKNEAGLRPMKRGFAARRGNEGRFASCSPKANASWQRSCRFMFAEQTLHSFVSRAPNGRPYGKRFLSFYRSFVFGSLTALFLLPLEGTKEKAKQKENAVKGDFALCGGRRGMRGAAPAPRKPLKRLDLNLKKS